MTFKPVLRKCLYCKEAIYLIEPTEKVKCFKCGREMAVIHAKTVRLSKVVSESK